MMVTKRKFSTQPKLTCAFKNTMNKVMYNLWYSTFVFLYIAYFTYIINIFELFNSNEFRLYSSILILYNKKYSHFFTCHMMQTRL